MLSGPRRLKSHAKGHLAGLDSELTELERRAGIEQAAQDAREAIPLFLYPLRGDRSDEEVDREIADHRRDEIRRLYFAIKEISLRKALITKDRECEQAAGDVWEDEIGDL